MKRDQPIRTIVYGLMTGLLTCLCLLGYGQEVKVVSSLDTNRILLGDQVILTLTVTTPENTPVKFPVLPDTFSGEVEVLESTLTDTIQLKKEGLTVDQAWLLTSFKEGAKQIPSLPVVVGKDTYTTEPLSFQVIPVEVDTSKIFRPIKGPVNVGYSFWEIFRWFLLAFLIIGLSIGGYFGYKWLKRKLEVLPPPEPEEPPKPVIPPHVIALREFEVLKEEQLWQAGNIKEYHSRVTDILRTYIEAEFDMLAMEQTSSEILQSFRDKGLTSSVPFMELKQILSLADLVKFAKAQPLANENEQSLENAIRFVKATALQVRTPETSSTPPEPAVEPEAKPEPKSAPSGWVTIKEEPETSTEDSEPDNQQEETE